MASSIEFIAQQIGGFILSTQGENVILCSMWDYGADYFIYVHVYTVIVKDWGTHLMNSVIKSVKYTIFERRITGSLPRIAPTNFK